MNKRALMLTAATVALLSGRAHADTTNCATASSTATLCDITTVVVTPIATSTASNTGTANDVTFEATGGINVAVASAALKIDSNNNVINFGTISNKNTTGAIGVEINADNTVTPGTTTGSYEGLLGTIDLSGSGTGKTGLLLDLPTGSTSGTFNGGTTGISVGTMNVVGDSSYGIHILDTNATGASYVGSLIIDGGVTVSASSTTSTSSTSDVGVELDGGMTGNFSVVSGGAVVATGQGSEAILLLGQLDGYFFNGGTVESVGIATPATTGGNPEGGSAFIIANNITGGIENGGPLNTSDTTSRAIIATSGTGPALFITPSSGGAAIDIGVYAGDTARPGYSFYNRGQISSAPADANFGSIGMRILGAAGTPVTLDGLGIFNSGAISSSARNDTTAQNGTATTALWIGDYAIVPSLFNSNEVGTGTGNITASVSGAMPSQAIAILIDTHGSLTTLTNSGTISATAQTSDTTNTGITAYAILDRSGTLNSITNSGTISAQTTTLDNNAQTHVAASLSANTSGVLFNNTGSVVGDVFFGSGNDTFNVNGSSSQGASVIGNIDFFGGTDTLAVGDFSTVAGAVLERGGGYANVTVGVTGGAGALFVDNTNFAGNSNYDDGTFEVGSLDVKGGAHFGISLSQGFNQSIDPLRPAVVSAAHLAGGQIKLETGSFFDITFGSFISVPGGGSAKFTLLDAPLNNIIIGNPTAIKDSIHSTIPFLFTSTVCGYNVAGFQDCAGTAPSDSQLILELDPKSVSDLGLTGYAAQMFPLANAALASDNELGSAVIAAGTGLTNSAADQAKGTAIYQSIYSQFAPDVTGASRALAISLTDSETGAVGARQRVLRMYAGQDAQATLWGQEFVQRFNNNTKELGGYRDSGFGFAIGMDGGSPSNGRYGGAFTFFSGDIIELLPAQVKTSSEWYMLSGYSDWRGKGLFFDGQVTVGYGALNGKRVMTIDSPTSGSAIMTREADGKRAGLLGSLSGTTGYIFSMGSMTLTPQASIDALTMREEGYRESNGGPGFDLIVNPYYAKSLRGYLGASVREDLNFSSFFIQPEARIGYRYDFLSDAVNLKAQFAGDPGTNPVIAPGSLFNIIGPDPAKGNLVAGAGIATTTGAWSLGINYDYLRGGAGTNSMAGTITLVGRI